MIVRTRTPCGRLLAQRSAAVTLLMLLASPAALADDSSHLTLLEENDSLYFNSDKHYTQGFEATYLSPDLRPESSWTPLFQLFPNGSGSVTRRYGIEFGQSIFTPKEVQLIPPDPRDRPYAGWLYLGANLLQESDHHILDSLDVQVGVVGPAALGKEVQNDFHQLIGKDTAKGWSSQLQNEPGLLVSYDRAWRVPLVGDARGGIDVVPIVGGSLGNVLIDGEAGGLVRIGHNLGVDYGPNRIRPALSGTSYFNADALEGDVGYYFFAGAQGRAVAHNIFLDGNSFRDSRSVTHKALVADLQSGFSVFWSRGWRLDFSVDRRTEEFAGQATPDVIGTAALSFAW